MTIIENKEFKIHPMDNPIMLYSGDIFRNNIVTRTGSFYGRYLFTDNVLLETAPKALNVRILNNMFYGSGNSAAISIE
jgi:hypothetical protein